MPSAVVIVVFERDVRGQHALTPSAVAFRAVALHGDLVSLHRRRRVTLSTLTATGASTRGSIPWGGLKAMYLKNAKQRAERAQRLIALKPIKRSPIYITTDVEFIGGNDE